MTSASPAACRCARDHTDTRSRNGFPGPRAGLAAAQPSLRLRPRSWNASSDGMFHGSRGASLASMNERSPKGPRQTNARTSRPEAPRASASGCAGARRCGRTRGIRARSAAGLAPCRPSGSAPPRNVSAHPPAMTSPGVTTSVPSTSQARSPLRAGTRGRQRIQAQRSSDHLTTLSTSAGLPRCVASRRPSRNPTLRSR
jgi:hypothetical protein